MQELFLRHKTLQIWQACPYFDASLSAGASGAAPVISAIVPLSMETTVSNSDRLRIASYEADISRTSKNRQNINITASDARTLQETRIDISGVPAGSTALAVLQSIANALNLTLVYDAQGIGNLQTLICCGGYAQAPALQVLKDICNSFGYFLSVETPERLRIISAGSGTAEAVPFFTVQDFHSEKRYSNLVINKVSPNAAKKSYAFARQIGLDKAQLQDPNMQLLVGEYEQNDGLSATDYKTYKEAYKLEYDVDQSMLFAMSLRTGILHNTPTADLNKALFFCAPCTEIVEAEKAEHTAAMLRGYGMSLVSYYAEYKATWSIFSIFCPPSWIAGRDIYATGSTSEPGGDLSFYKIFTDYADTQIVSATAAAVVEYLPGAGIKEGWMQDTLDVNDPDYNNSSIQYPNIIQYPANKIENFNLPANENWPYWPFRRYIESKDDSGELSGRIDYPPPYGGTKSIEASWKYVKSINFTLSKYDAGFSNISGLSAAEVSSESFFDPRKNAMLYKDSFYLGGASNLHGAQGIANMGQLPNIKYSVKKDPNYILITLQPSKIKAAVSARWNYAGVKAPVFTVSAEPVNIAGFAGPAAFSAAEIIAVSGGNGEATAADVSYSIGSASPKALAVTSQLWGTRAACEAAAPIFPIIYGDLPDYVTFEAPLSAELAPGSLVEFGEDILFILSISYNFKEGVISAKGVTI